MGSFKLVLRGHLSTPLAFGPTFVGLGFTVLVPTIMEIRLVLAAAQATSSAIHQLAGQSRYYMKRGLQVVMIVYASIPNAIVVTAIFG